VILDERHPYSLPPLCCGPPLLQLLVRPIFFPPAASLHLLTLQTFLFPLHIQSGPCSSLVSYRLFPRVLPRIVCAADLLPGLFSRFGQMRCAISATFFFSERKCSRFFSLYLLLTIIFLNTDPFRAWAPGQLLFFGGFFSTEFRSTLFLSCIFPSTIL